MNIFFVQGSQLGGGSPSALGIGAASFASEALAERAKIERKARRRSGSGAGTPEKRLKAKG